MAAIAVANYQRSSLARKAERQESLLGLGAVWVFVRIRKWILEERGCLFEAYAVLSEVGSRLPGVPLEEHGRSLAACDHSG